jgi:DNA polymerase delta subunit 1
MAERDKATAPQVGDRVSYVMVKALKGSKGFEKSEDPLYVLQNNLPVDYEYYL